MNPQELKNSILQLAIQGRLVEQRPEEGTAEELFAQIQAQKRQLIKEGKIKKEKPLPEIKEEEIPFEIPEGWIWARLSDFCEIVTGNTPFKQNKSYYGKDYPLYKPTDLDAGYDVATAGDMLSERGYEVSRKLPANTVLVTCIGATIGKTGLIRSEGSSNQQINAIIPYVEIMPEYIYFLCTSDFFQNQIHTNASATTLPIINKRTFEKLLFVIPPLAEQKRIVAKIEELQPYIDRYEQAWSKLETLNKRFPTDMQKSILQMAIQGKLVEQRPEEGTAEELFAQIRAQKQQLIKEGKIKKEKTLPEIAEDEKPFDIPESWKWVRFSELALFENGDRSSKYPVDTDYVPFGVPFFGAKDMSPKYMSFENVRYISQMKYEQLGNGKLQDGDFICLLRGSVGKTAIFRADERHSTGFICAQMVIVRCLNLELLEFIFSFIKTPYYSNLIESKVTGTAVRQLPAKELANVLIPLPPLAEQKRIVAKLEEILPLCAKLKRAE